MLIIFLPYSHHSTAKYSALLAGHGGAPLVPGSAADRPGGGAGERRDHAHQDQ